MLSQSHRFHGRNSLKYVYQTGKVARGPLFSVRASPNQRRSQYRVAVVVSRKTVKSAVKRNRIRRRFYAATRDLAAHINGPQDIVITVFAESIADLTSAELQQQLKAQLKSAGAL